ncbi:MAG: nucleotidyltransferase family protein [Alphaproteobacteria bacterium]|nr:nucleotidyltransferase family protein [Alphaproteobacteria bacterium]
MKAILLSAGLGTRLRPLTLSTPKCLVPILGRPLMAYWLEQLDAAGVEEFIVNTHYLPQAVADFIVASPWRDRVRLVHEERLLGTGGTLLANKAFLENDDIFVAHADNLCLCDFSDFFAAHAKHPKECLMTMMLFNTETPQSCGIVELDKQERVIAFHEKTPNPSSRLANAAVYIMSADFIRWLTEAFPYADTLDISTQVIPRLMKRIYTWPTNGYLRDIGTPESLAAAEADMRRAPKGHP